MLNLKELLCGLIGHAGPKGVPYKESAPAPRVSGNTTLRNTTLRRIEWDCPRCGQSVSALAITADDVPRAPGARPIEDHAN